MYRYCPAVALDAHAPQPERMCMGCANKTNRKNTRHSNQLCCFLCARTVMTHSISGPTTNIPKLNFGESLVYRCRKHSPGAHSNPYHFRCVYCPFMMSSHAGCQCQFPLLCSRCTTVLRQGCPSMAE